MQSYAAEIPPSPPLWLQDERQADAIAAGERLRKDEGEAGRTRERVLAGEVAEMEEEIGVLVLASFERGRGMVRSGNVGVFESEGNVEGEWRRGTGEIALGASATASQEMGSKCGMWGEGEVETAAMDAPSREGEEEGGSCEAVVSEGGEGDGEGHVGGKMGGGNGAMLAALERSHQQVKQLAARLEEVEVQRAQAEQRAALREEQLSELKRALTVSRTSLSAQ